MLIAACCCSFLYTFEASATDVDAISLSRASDRLSVEIDLSGDVNYNVFSLDNPDRLVIDIENTQLPKGLPELDFAQTPIKSIRSGVRNGDDLRIVLDLNSVVEHSHYFVAADSELPDRLVVNLLGENSVVSTSTRTVPVVAQSDKRDILVAVVAGHGGEDPGAPSHNRRLWEKDVTLAISRAIESRLEQTQGYKPVMIRDGDYSLNVKARPVLARDKRVDIYISIHADSYSGSSVQGVTIYALSGETADQENIRRVEEKENMADLIGGVAGDTRISDVDDDLAFTLLDLSMAWNMEQSLELGSHVLASLDGVAKLRKDKVQGGNLWELRSPDIPSILIETGYLSNPEEAEQLATPAYQRDLAAAIVQGLQNYFYESPPDDTLIAWQKRNGVAPQSYLVKRDDNLSVIAQRFNVSVSELKIANGLQGDVIHVGQSLTIPGAFGVAMQSEHKIISGETLSEIAQRYRVSVSNLRRVNNLSGDTIRIGQVLKIPTS